MTEPHLIRRFTGLFNSVNPYAVAPEGALAVGENCVIHQVDVLEPRRGYSSVAWNALGAIGFKEGKILALAYDGSATGRLDYYDSTTQAFTSLPMTPGGLPFDRPAGNASWHTNFISVNKSTYFQSRYGLTKMEALSGAVCRAALQPKMLIDTVAANFTNIALVNSSGVNWLATGFQVAYRFTVCRLGANSELIESEPSERYVVSNTSGGARATLINTINSYMVPPDAFFRIYRSKQIANGTDPADELFLVAEVLATGAPDANGYAPVGTGSLYTDQTQDALLGPPLYTNPYSGNGFSAAASTAPAAADMAYFKNRLLLLNTTDVQRLEVKIIGTGNGGIVDGDTITVAGLTFTFRAPSVTSREVNIFTSGTVAQNLENTARNMVSKFNAAMKSLSPALQSAVTASYVSTPDTAPGLVLFQSILPGAQAFTLQTSAATGWDADYRTAVSSDPNAQLAGLSWSLQGQPEAVPLFNAAAVGDASSDGLRILPLKEAALIFKKGDGLWKWTDDGTAAGTALVVADPTVRLIAPATAQAVDNFAFALCDQGVLEIAESGAHLNISNDPIGRELQKLIGFVGLDTLGKVAFAVSYERDRSYILCLPESPNATCCTVQYWFNLDTRAWTTSRLPGVVAGGVDPATGKLVWAMTSAATAPGVASSVWIERKNGDSTDYQDPGFSTRCTESTSVATFLFVGDLRTGPKAIAAGDVFLQQQSTYMIQQRVVSVTYDSGTDRTTVTLDAAPTHPWNVDIVPHATLQVLKAISCTVRFLPFHAGQPMVMKSWGDTFLAFRYLDLDFLEVDWSSELYPVPDVAIEQITGTDPAAEPQVPVLLDGFGSSAFGSKAFDRQAEDIVLRVTMPQNVSESALLTLQLVMQNALARWELSAIDVKVEGGSQSVVR